MMWIAVCGVTFAAARSDSGWGWFVLVFIGPFCGAGLHRWRGGSGILGGIVGGFISYEGFGIIIYARYSLMPRGPNVVDYLGPVLALSFLAIAGTSSGLAFGIVFCFLMKILDAGWKELRRVAQPTRPDDDL